MTRDELAMYWQAFRRGAKRGYSAAIRPLPMLCAAAAGCLCGVAERVIGQGAVVLCGLAVAVLLAHIFLPKVRRG